MARRTVLPLTALLGVLLVVSACGATGRRATLVDHATNASDADGHLVIGALVPQTGDLASLGAAESAGVEAAVHDINAAGGVLGHPVTLVRADSGEGIPAAGRAAAHRLRDRHADVVVGGRSPAVSVAVPGPHPRSWRVTPPVALQATALAHLILGAGHERIAVLARENRFGTAVADELESDLVDGGATVTTELHYRPSTDSFSSYAVQIRATHPDAVVVLGYDETRKILLALAAHGIGPHRLQVYLGNGNTSDYSEDFPAGTMTGVEGTHAGGTPPPAFVDKLRAIDPYVTDPTDGPEAYDAVVLAALAVEAAHSDSPSAYAKEVVAVSRGGRTCATFAACDALAKQGSDLDYQGVSGSLDLDAAGDPEKATVGTVRYTSSNTYLDTGEVTGAG